MDDVESTSKLDIDLTCISMSNFSLNEYIQRPMWHCTEMQSADALNKTNIRFVNHEHSEIVVW